MKSEPIILLDMDGVLYDFTGAALAAHGSSETIYHHENAKGVWDIPMLLGISQEEFWRPLDNGAFWDKVPLIAGAQDFVANLRRLAPVYFASVPSRSPECWRSKVAAVYRDFGVPESCDRILLGSAKRLLAAPDRILIDDNDKNVKAHASGGGVSVLFPRPWNKLWASAFYDYNTQGHRACVMTPVDQLYSKTLMHMKLLLPEGE